MRNPEPRFYPSYYMKADINELRAMPMGQRMAMGMRFSDEIRQLLFERIQQIHPDWSHDQQMLMLFKLSYKGEHFEEFCAAKIKRGDFTPAEVEAVRAVPIPTERANAERYASISHPDLDTSRIFWP